jgi:hypothetical protein
MTLASRTRRCSTRRALGVRVVMCNEPILFHADWDADVRLQAAPSLQVRPSPVLHVPGVAVASMLDQLLLSAGLFKLQELLISMLQVFAKHSSRAHRATDKLSVLRKERSSWNHSSSVALSTSCIVMVRSTMVSLV